MTVEFDRELWRLSAINLNKDGIMTYDETVNQLAERIMKRERIKCDCGGPQLGTDHAPDCNLNLAWDVAVEDAKQEIYEKDMTFDDA